jgi:hypothetical protein
VKHEIQHNSCFNHTDFPIGNLFFPQEKSPGKSLREPSPIGYPLNAVPIRGVQLEEGFWANRMKTHLEVTIPHVLRTLQIDYSDPVPSRSQLALVRTLEGVSYSLMIKNDPKTEAMMDKMSTKIGELFKSGENTFWKEPFS